ncbi:RNA endoribonuclease involved in mRNP quality control Swt1 [Schizosaccharomyces pombe]|uniref:Transcriptional protein swt1 n=1 Tax=Schizosaccharomyces pombe (strain 972 / ATCC 24843) TaxID=284812 RepID=SWT1_SCHPO|nr:putative RNA endoribonuclease [Schizosaccharomyces pombe]Q9P7J1.2 RecName: Full=Transcriptional protein swt1 [Schizosaccharomyces pombe 972h-]CAB76224.2 RNA endoribonuclease involved in mRNP quality control (predicted) [Schizosaccharomyces pombe]|eukprot:NP_001342947.1 putative RNA endoribonuclease [Schizosaccharomyces pombe]
MDRMEIDDQAGIDFVTESINSERARNRWSTSHIPSLSEINPSSFQSPSPSPFASSTSLASKPARYSKPLGLFVLDTNFLLSHLSLCQNLIEFLTARCPRLVVVLPWTVLQELDGLKSESSSTCGYLARQAHNFLLQCFRSNVSSLRGQKVHEHCSSTEKGDDAILDCCIYYQEEKLIPAVLLSDDKNLSIKAAVHHIQSLSFSKGLEAASIVQTSFPSAFSSNSENLENLSMDIDLTVSQPLATATNHRNQGASTVDIPMDRTHDNSIWASRYAHFPPYDKKKDTTRSAADYIPYTYTALTKEEILHASHPRACKLLDQITKIMVEETAFLLSRHLLKLWGDYDLAMTKLLASPQFPPQNINDVGHELYIHWYTCFDGYLPAQERSNLKSKAELWNEWMLWAERGIGIGPKNQEELQTYVTFWSNIWTLLSRREILGDQASTYIGFREQNIEKWVERSGRERILS